MKFDCWGHPVEQHDLFMLGAGHKMQEISYAGYDINYMNNELSNPLGINASVGITHAEAIIDTTPRMQEPLLQEPLIQEPLVQPPLIQDSFIPVENIDNVQETNFQVDHQKTMAELIQESIYELQPPVNHEPATIRQKNIDDSKIKKSEEGQSRMWSDRDYPFFPRPRGGRPKIVKAKIPRIPRLRTNYRELKENLKCPVCGAIRKDETYCENCKTRFCAFCHEILTDGKCNNENCILNEKVRCIECGKEKPCECGS